MRASKASPAAWHRGARQQVRSGKNGSADSRNSQTAQTPDLDRSNSLADLAARIRAEHEATIAALKSSVIHAMAAGDLLTEAKAQVPHGQWLPWFSTNCTMSERSGQLYMRLAKHRATIEKEMAKSAMGIADLTLNEAAALCALADRLKRLFEVAKHAEDASPEQLVDLCVAEGFTLIKDEGSYNPFFGRSEAEIREWILFGFFIGGGSQGAFNYVEWILQRPFQNVDEWLGPEGSKFRKRYGWQDSKPKFHTAWTQFKADYADMTRDEIIHEIVQLVEAEKLEGLSYLVGMAATYRSPPSGAAS
jgi:DUF3102 family protein